MKYLVNRKTKEHCVYPEGYEYNCIQFAEVQADPEGWIKHDGTKCPLPDDALCAIRFKSGALVDATRAVGWGWWDATHYRPILEDKRLADDEARDYDMTQSEGHKNQCSRLGYDPRSVSFNIIDRLTAAHKAASEIPDLVAELRQALEPMGLGVMYLSQFDEVTK